MSRLKLAENPFYILEASIYDDKTTIQQAAEDKSFFDDEDNGEMYERAATILTSPKKRISAEMRWFVGCSSTQEKEIIERLDNKSYYGKRFFCTLAELNCNVYQMEYQDLTVETIMLIGALYERQDLEEILSYINEGREKSKFPPIRDTADIKSELKEIREEIRRTFQFKIKELSRKNLIKLADELADLVIDAKQCNAIVDDFFSKVYAVYMDARIDEILGEILDVDKNLEDSPNESNFRDIEILVRELSEILKPLDKMVGIASTVKENYAEKVFYHLRGNILDWYKEKDLLDEPLRLAKILLECFGHIEELRNRAETDVKDLEDLQQERLEWKKFIERSEKIIALAKNLENDSSERALGKLESEIRSYASLIKGNEIESNLAEDLFLGIRSAIIDLNDKKNSVDEPLRITKVLAECFGHFKKISDKAKEDIKTLEEMKSNRQHIKQISDCIDKIDSLLKILKGNQSKSNINALINEVRNFSNLMKNEKDLEKIVERVFYDVRSFAIDFYNENGLVEESLQILKDLSACFGHVQEFRNKVNDDIKQLEEIQHDRFFNNIVNELKQIDTLTNNRLHLERNFESANLRFYDEFQTQCEPTLSKIVNNWNYSTEEKQLIDLYVASIYNQMGMGMAYANRLDLALKFFEKALPFAEKANDIKFLSNVNKNLNDCRKYLSQNSYSSNPQSNSSGCAVFIIAILTAMLLNFF